jgi:predicted amidophosphoribosyltransferase
MNLGALLAETAQLFWPARCAGCNGYVPGPALFCESCAPSVNPLWAPCPGCALPLEEMDLDCDAGTLGGFPGPPATDSARQAELRPPFDCDPGTLGGFPGPPATDSARQAELRLHAYGRCASCRQAPLPFAAAAAGFEYGEALAHGIVRMKHGGRRDLCHRLGRLLVVPLARTLVAGRFGPGDAVVPVPLHPGKLRQRGFNQALELARRALALLARRRDLWPRPRRAPVLERRLLRRIRATRELGHLGPAARLAEVAGAFAVRDPAAVLDRRVLLIDDVFTTGATFQECARTLRAAGAREVRVLALARAV